MAATVLVNLSPPESLYRAMLKLWEQGHFLNLKRAYATGLAIWTLAALAY